MSPDQRAACLARLEAAERELTAVRAILSGTGPVEPVGDLIRIKEAAAEYGVSEQTARRWARKSGVRQFGVWFVRRSRVAR